MNHEKKNRIANETIEIYAPIAHRLGMHQIYRELEDLAFEILYPLRFRVIEEAVKNNTRGRKKILKKVETSISQKLQVQDLDKCCNSNFALLRTSPRCKLGYCLGCCH